MNYNNRQRNINHESHSLDSNDKKTVNCLSFTSRINQINQDSKTTLMNLSKGLIKQSKNYIWNNLDPSISSNISKTNQKFIDEHLKESIQVNLKPVSILDKSDSKNNDSVNDSKNIL